MKCSSCGAPNPQGKRFCADCGTPLSVACAACGSANAPNSKFCGDCGHGLVEFTSRSEQPADTSRSTGTAAQDAERRQLTVMFCDLVGSTLLANRLDPEEMRSVLRGFHSAVGGAVAP